jgi:hypothetical protein
MPLQQEPKIFLKCDGNAPFKTVGIVASHISNARCRSYFGGRVMFQIYLAAFAGFSEIAGGRAARLRAAVKAPLTVIKDPRQSFRHVPD